MTAMKCAPVVMLTLAVIVNGHPKTKAETSLIGPLRKGTGLLRAPGRLPNPVMPPRPLRNLPHREKLTVQHHNKGQGRRGISRHEPRPNEPYCANERCRGPGDDVCEPYCRCDGMDENGGYLCLPKIFTLR
ncbi:hypothetical protein MTO96_051140 [Rhipicephalus appendiculatus]